eukprot:s3847_g14.t1
MASDKKEKSLQEILIWLASQLAAERANSGLLSAPESSGEQHVEGGLLEDPATRMRAQKQRPFHRSNKAGQRTRFRFRLEVWLLLFSLSVLGPISVPAQEEEYKVVVERWW